MPLTQFMTPTKQTQLITTLRATFLLLFSIGFEGNANTAANGADQKPLKIINWNVLYGFNHGQSVDAGTRWLNDQQPDIAAFQELNGISEAQLKEIAQNWEHSFAVTHKENGFPVGLTSKFPITVHERKVEGFHHGYLHAETAGIHFFVVHFWPGKYQEADVILHQARALLKDGERVIVLGDFNGSSRRDEDFLIKHAILRERDYIYNDKLEAAGFIDLVAKHDPEAKISCPSPITIPRWSKDLKELKQKQYRIDFIFADPALAKRSVTGTIHLSPELDRISDHYPVVMEILPLAGLGTESEKRNSGL